MKVAAYLTVLVWRHPGKSRMQQLNGITGTQTCPVFEFEVVKDRTAGLCRNLKRVQ